MPIAESEFALSRDPRLWAQFVDHATSPSPAWLWSADGSRILWANAVGAAIFGAANTTALTGRRFEAKQPAAVAIVRLAETLPSTGQARLERLRGFGASFGHTLTCVCSRFSLPNGSPAVLVVANEPAGPALPLGERVKRLFSDQSEAQAAFAPDGTLLAATAEAQKRFAGTPTLSAFGLTATAAQALAAGGADATTNHGPVTLRRLGSGASAVLLATFGDELSSVSAVESASPRVEPAPTSEPELGLMRTQPPVLPPAAEPKASAATPSESELKSESNPVRSPPPAEPVVERRHPLRFVWQMDADGRFVVGSDEFIELTGPQTTAAFGRLWSEIAAELKLDPDQQVARAVATRETWSGITVSWPVDDGDTRLPVELSGLPVFDRERHFRGYRGFGVCRDIARINELAHARRERPIGFMARPEPPATGNGGALAHPGPVEATAADTKAAVSPSPSAEEAQGVRPPQRPPLGAAPAANVVLFRPGMSEPKTPSLSPVERRAFRELAQELTARLQGGRDHSVADSMANTLPAAGVPTEFAETSLTPPNAEPIAPELADAAPAAAEVSSALVSATVQQAAESPVVAEVDAAKVQASDQERRSEIEVQRQAAPAFEPVLLDRLPLGVLFYRNNSVLYANRHFLELTGYQSLGALTAAGWLKGLVAETDAGTLSVGGVPSKLSLATFNGERRDIEARLFEVPWEDASALTLILTDREIADQQASALSLRLAEAEIRDLASKLEAAKKSEDQLRAATREAQRAAAAKAEFVGKVSHEIRTPLNAIVGFTEVIMAERFGPIGNERYRDYLNDVHAAGMHIVALLNDLLDLSKIESGQLTLSFGNVSLNELTQQCVGIMQPQASRARIIIRTSLTPGLPQVVADERSLRQIVLNLLSNSIKFTGPGGQVIVSTACADNGEAVLRVRDTGVGMSEKDVEAALEPFRQTATAGTWGSGGTGLGLPLTKALAEANRAHFSIKSAPNAGTLIEVAFPPTRMVAQ